MLAIASSPHTKVGAFLATTPRSRPSSSHRSICRCQAESGASSRRSLLAGGAAGVAALLAAAPVLFTAGPAQSFGVGFPGYDISIEGRKRATDRNKKEMNAELARAAEYRRKLAEQKAAAAAAGGAAPAAPATSK